MSGLLLTQTKAFSAPTMTFTLSTGVAGVTTGSMTGGAFSLVTVSGLSGGSS